ncbi:MAG: outer membrane beta-barrel protein [Hyphomonas sp.]
MKLALVSLAAILAAPIAVAQGNVELSAGYSKVDTEAGDLGAITGRGSYFFNRYLGAEGEVSIGIDDTDFGIGTVELDQSFGAFGVLRAPLTERFELFGRAGYATSKFSASVPGLGSASEDIDGLAYGVGGKLFLTDRFGIRADASRYEGDDNEADVFTVGGVVRF